MTLWELIDKIVDKHPTGAFFAFFFLCAAVASSAHGIGSALGGRRCKCK